MDLDQDHGRIAWSNWTAQFKDSPRLRSVVMALLQPFTTVQGALKQLRDDRWLDAAVGAQLDGLGDLLDRPRRITNTRAIWHFGFQGQPNIGGFGEFPMYRVGAGLFTGGSTLDDENYRRLLRWKVLVDSGFGTAAQIEGALRVLFAEDRIAVEDLGNARIRVHIGRKATEDDYFLGNVGQWVPSAAGVALEFRTYETDEPFEFDSTNYLQLLVGDDGALLLGHDGYQLIGKG